MASDPQTTLKPCPFCGGKPKWYEADRDNAQGFYDHSVYALECSNPACPVGLSMDVDTWDLTKEKTAQRWNTRHVEA